MITLDDPDNYSRRQADMFEAISKRLDLRGQEARGKPWETARSMLVRAAEDAYRELVEHCGCSPFSITTTIGPIPGARTAGLQVSINIGPDPLGAYFRGF